MTNDALNAVKREGTGKEKAKKLRVKGLIPAIYYHRGDKPVSLSLNLIELNRIYRSGNKIIDLAIDGKKSKKVLIRDMQFHPVTENILHIDFQGVSLSEEIHISVPIKLNGAGSAPGVKEGGIVESLIHELEVKCKVSNVPNELEIDISELELGHGIYVKDVEFPDIEILLPSDTMICVVSTPSGSSTSEEEEEGEETEEGEESTEEGSED
ncbi:MAG: 50S ribosomal protein L25 [Candidatus Marinimicrobia bacterium]|nr:50S ribosomal protein L25 [Candidatus Neomarinimicrobiota bacterium]